MDDLLLVAAGGLARETLAAVRATGRHRVVGVLDDDPARHGTTLDGVPVLGGLQEAGRHPDAQLVLCAGRGQARRDLARRLAVPPGRWARVVAPGADLAAGTTVGPGTIVLAGVVSTTAVDVGAHVVLMPRVVLTHDCVVADHATLAAGVTLGGHVHVGEAAYLGMASSVRQHVRVGAGSVLGMGAVLLDDLPAGQTWAGVPARPLPHRAQEARP